MTLGQVRRDNQHVMDGGPFNMLKSVHTESGVFAEIFVNVSQLQCFARLIVSDFQKLQYSTTTKGAMVIRRYQDSDMRFSDRCNAVLRGHDSKQWYENGNKIIGRGNVCKRFFPDFNG